MSLEVKVALQKNRMDYIKKILDEIPQLTENPLKQDIVTRLQLLESYWSKFETSHERICELKFEGLLAHEYFTSGRFDICIGYHTKALADLLTLRDDLETALPLSGHALADVSLAHPPSSSRGTLPKLQLMAFSGDYQQWRPFHDIFTSMVGSHPELSTVEKMHYLKSSLTGEAAQLIVNLPVTGDSFCAAWDQLVERYENKRILITSQLDKLFSALPITSKSSKGLNSLLCTTSEALNSLRSLGAPVDQWDMILVRLMVRNLDSASREAWEIQLGSSTEYPTLEQLRKFLTGRARALESLEIEKSRTSLKPTSKCPTRSYASTVESEAPSRPPPSSEDRTTKSQACDDCGGDHYIAFCPRFKERSPASRDQVVTDKWLCFNCLGRHNLRMCRNKTTCRHCRGRHHSLLHHYDTPPSSYQRAST